MIFAETDRLRLRALRHDDLQRYTELIGDWDVARWLTSVPFPYFMRDAEEFFAQMQEAYRKEVPELFLITDKTTGGLMGGVGLHPARPPEQAAGGANAEIGYWLGKPFWGQGVMTEAVKAVLAIGFRRPDLQRVTAVTDPNNHASQKVLTKAGLTYVGTEPRRNTALRGGDEIMRWECHRDIPLKN